MRILIVEDDRKLARQLKKGLDERGHSVTVAWDGVQGLDIAQYGQFDVLVLDVMLPGLDGFSIVRRLRAAGDRAPILLLTARDAADEVVAGLDAGADDYLTKPFSFKILQARLRALSRRKTVEPRTQLQAGDLVLDPATREVKRAGSVIALTRTEFLLLDLLMRNVGRVITRTRIIEAAWGHDRDIESNTLEVALQRNRSAGEYREARDEILGESERTSQVVDRLMLLARADSGTESLGCISVDARVIVRGSAEQDEKLARKYGLDFTASLPGAPVPIQADADALRRALLILIDNAVKYTPENGSVTIKLEASDSLAIVSVLNTGIGIAKEDLTRIFDRFWRADKARSREQGGAGLGLSIAKWIVAMHGGSIEVESKLGKGSTFHLRVPLAT
jgi:DNA-binding response OmpR family regulator